jgi:hypothetical protein
VAWWRRQVRWEDKEEEVTQGGMVATVEDHGVTHTSCSCRSPWYRGRKERVEKRGAKGYGLVLVLG